MKKFYILVLLLVFFLPTCQDSERKPVLEAYLSKNCDFCKRFRDALKDTDFAKEVKSLVSLKIQNRNAEADAKHKIRGVPTFILFVKSEVQYRIGFFRNKKTFLEELKYGLAGPNMSERERRFSERKKLLDSIFLGKFYEESGDLKAVSFYKDASLLISRRICDVYIGALLFEEDKGHLYPETEEIAKKLLASSQFTQWDILYLAKRMSGLAVKYNRNPVYFAQYVFDKTKAMLKQDCSEEEKKILTSRKKYAQLQLILYKEKNAPKAWKFFKSEILPENWESDFGELNYVAWFIFQNRVAMGKKLLELAEKLSEKSFRLSKKENVSEEMIAALLDTQACISYVLGKRDRAIKLIKGAIDNSPKKNYVQLLERIKAGKKL